MSEFQTLATGPAFSADHHKLPHILLIVDGFPKALGGGERVVLRLAALLPLYGYRASILTFARHPESAFKPQDAPCPVYLLPLTKTYGRQAVRGALALRRFLYRERVEVVQTFFESSDLWAGTITRLFSSAKLVWSRRDMGILRGAKHRFAYRALHRLPHAVAAVSHRVAGHVISTDKVATRRVHVIHNGLDLEFGSARRLGDAALAAAPHITTIGNLRHVKGQDLLLEAAAQVVREFPGTRFTFAGEVLEPAYATALEEQVRVLGLGGNVSFLGGISDLPAHLRQADVFVLPSRSEGFSNALVEAMAAGLPCVATDVGGNAEAVEHEVSGLIVPPENSTALAEALLSLLREPARAERLAQAAQTRAASEFSSEAMMRKVSALFGALRER